MTGDLNYHMEIIESLGGKLKLAAALGLPASGLAKWPTRGIPAKYWPYIVQMTEAASLIDLAKTKPAKRAYVPPEPPPEPIAATPKPAPAAPAKSKRSVRARPKVPARKRPKATKKSKKPKARSSA